MDCCGNVLDVNTVMLTAWAAFLFGLTTSLSHCIGMCGPLISTYSLAQGRIDKSWSNLAPALLLYHLGRINAYALIGLALGLVATIAEAALPSMPLRGAMFAISGVLMIILGLGLLGLIPTMRLVESSRLGRFAAERVMELIGTRRMAGRYLLGVANGFLPCGPVYIMATATLTAPTPVQGAGTMAMFGLGTVPVLLAVGLGAGRLAPTVQRWFNRVAAVLVIIVGLEFLFRAGKLFGLIKAIEYGFLPIW